MAGWSPFGGLSGAEQSAMVLRRWSRCAVCGENINRGGRAVAMPLDVGATRSRGPGKGVSGWTAYGGVRSMRPTFRHVTCTDT